MSMLAACLFAGCAADSHGPNAVAQETGASEPMTVTAGCSTCIFDIPGAVGCELAVKIDGKAYLVAGSDIDDHGDAHAADGLCNASSDAVVEGRIDGDRFVATSFKLWPPAIR